MSENSIQAAHELFIKALDYSRQGKGAEEKAAYDEIIRRFADSSDPEISRLVAKALLNKGVVSAQGIRFDEACALFDEVIEKFKNTKDPELQLRVAGALVNKGVVLTQQGRDRRCPCSLSRCGRELRHFTGDAAQRAGGKSTFQQRSFVWPPGENC